MPLPVLAGMALGTVLSAGSQYAVNAGLAKGNSKRALAQQRAYTDLSTQANMRLAKYNQELGFDTMQRGYEYQKQGIKDAGLNPALMYGTSGGGGMTTAPAQGVGTATEHGESKIESPNMAAAIANGEQMALLRAQTDNLNANTQKTMSETEKTKGETSTIPIQQESIKADTKLKGLQGHMQEIQNKIAADSAENAIAKVGIELQKSMQEVDQMVRENYIGNQTKETLIKQIKQEYLNTVLHNKEIKQKIQESTSNIQVNDATIQNMAKQITLKYDELYQSATHMNRQDVNEEWKQFMEQQNIPVDVGEKLLNILGLRAVLGGGGRNVIQGFKNKY